jgi:hypothetical protein
VTGAIVTTATAGSLDCARGVVASACLYQPDLPVYVLTADEPVGADLGATTIAVRELTAGLGLAVGQTLDQEEQVVFGLPFLLERVVAEAGWLLFVGPGCLVTGSTTGIERRLADHPVVLTALSVPRHRHSARGPSRCCTTGRRSCGRASSTSPSDGRRSSSLGPSVPSPVGIWPRLAGRR